MRQNAAAASKGTREGRVLRTRGSPKDKVCMYRAAHVWLPRDLPDREAQFCQLVPVAPAASRTASCLLLAVRGQDELLAGERPVSE